jgi:peptidoglycan/LPS O-acetylase OafA/YrhL
LRLFAATAVLINHSGDLFLGPDGWFREVPWTGGVDIFFVISGFVMTYLCHDRFGCSGAAKDFLIRRAIRVIPPYWLFTTLVIAAALLLPRHVHYSHPTPATSVTSYLFIPWPRADGALNPLLSQGWTLNYEVLFYIAFAIALLFRNGLRWLIAGLVALVSLGFWGPATHFLFNFWTQPIILEFAAGIALALVYIRGLRLSGWAAIGLAAAAVATYASMSGIATSPVIRLAKLGAPALLLCTAVILAPQIEPRSRTGRLVSRGGDISYTLYLSHTFTISIVLIVWQWAGVQSPWLAMTLACAAAIIVADLVYRIIERPMTHALLLRISGYRKAKVRVGP